VGHRGRSLKYGVQMKGHFSRESTSSLIGSLLFMVKKENSRCLRRMKNRPQNGRSDSEADPISYLGKQTFSYYLPNGRNGAPGANGLKGWPINPRACRK
jgi:hypothetical protein